jgi:hypothetical protein
MLRIRAVSLPIPGGFVPKASDKQPELPENPLIAELLARGAENARVLQGFIGPSRDEYTITLYQSLDRLGDTVEIRREDVLHSVKSPRSGLGAVILWVNAEAQLSVRRTRPETQQSKTGPGSLREVSKGRLRMRMRSQSHAADQVCLSVCFDCLSWCDCNICETPV